MGYFIEALGYVLAHGAEGGGDNEKQQDDRANAPLSAGRGRDFLTMQRPVEISRRRHRASSHNSC
jgi:hypothetical protein